MKVINRKEFKRIDHTPAGALIAGDVVIAGKIKGYVTSLIPAGVKGSIVVDGIAECEKATGSAWTRDCDLYWNSTAKYVTVTATDNEFIGVAEIAAASADEVGRVLWNSAL